MKPLPLRRTTLLLGLSSSLAFPALAGNGINLTGFGAQSLAMGSADIAVGGSSAAVNINPANLSTIPGQRIDGSIEPYSSFGYRHQDDRNYKQPDKPYGLLTNFSYSTKAFRPDLTFGAGLFVAGGAGVIYEDLNTIFGTRDDYTAIFGVTKLATGLAWQVNDRLSIGGGVNLSYASFRQKLYPKTSDAGAQFFGLRLDGADGVSVNGRIGIAYMLTETLRLGATYSTINKLTLEGGELSVNYTALGEGVVRYDDATVKGFALPQDFGIGLSWRVAPSLLLATEVTWLDWSGALKNATLRASNPGNANVPQTLEVVQALNFRDQFVFALGLAYDTSDRTTVMAGINLARNPIPNSTLTPAINLTQELEFNAGFSHKLGKTWSLASALQFQPGKSEAGRNPAQPFVNNREGYGVLALMFEVSRQW